MRREPPLKPLVLIGAARSGTKACRDALAIATGVPPVPFDVGYIWREGHESLADDVVPPEVANPQVARRIQRFLTRYADGDGRLVEKTVGNTLRVPFVSRVLPDATFVHLIRDGVDVVESSRRQWTAPTDLRYLVRKARHFPPRLAGTYGLKFVRNSLRWGGDTDHVKSWGPRYPGIDTDVAQGDLLRVCARQWRECVLRASADLRVVPNPVVEVRYETLASDPAATLSRIVQALPGYRTTPHMIERAAATIHGAAAGVGRQRLTGEERRLLGVEIGDWLERLGYEPV